MIKRYVVFVVSIMIAVVISAQNPSSHQSVGLVMSGGGAKGIAHIGVIQALEENDIPIDYIAGTSMGAIVGGLYAAGYTPMEMMDLITSREFAYWSTGQIDQKLVYNFFKESQTPALINIPILKNDSTRTSSILPGSMISPLPMNFAFMDLFAAYNAQCGSNFNHLMVPYRCVASDVYAKHKLVLSSGDFGDAIRASMSFPTIFQPIEIDSMLVYDGGIYDNFPVDVMREDFAPSIMIGSDVANHNSKPKAGDLIDQLEDMIMRKSDYSMPADEGVLIQMDLSKYSLLDFPKAWAIYQVGYDKAISMIDSIKERVTVRIPAEARDLRRRVFKSKTPYVRFNSVKVTGGTRSQDEYLTYLFTKNRKDTFGLEEARMAYYQAITTGNLRNLVPHAVYNPTTGLFALDMKATVKNNFRVGFGGYLTSSTNSMIFLSGSYNTLSFHGIQTNVNGWIGQSYMGGALNGRLFLPTHRPSSLEFQGIVSRQKFYENDNLFYQDKMPTFIVKNEGFGRLNYAWAIGRSGKGEFGVGGGHLHTSFFENDLANYYNAGRDNTYLNLAQARWAYDRNTLDNPNFPTGGSRYHAVAMGLLGHFKFIPYHNEIMGQSTGVRWLQLEVSAQNYFGFSRNFSLGTSLEGLVSTRKLVNSYDAAIVNATGFHPTPSSYNAFYPHFRANSYGAAGLMPIWRPMDRLQLRGDFHLFMPYKAIKDDNGRAYYGTLLSDPEFFGEMALVYNFPFNAALSLYGNYYSSPARNWNCGITFGAFFLAPRFLQ